jgi:hypothetical protein
MGSGRTSSVRCGGVSIAVIIASVLLVGMWVVSCVSLIYYSDGYTWQITACRGAASVSWGEPPGWPYRLAYEYGFFWDAFHNEGPLVLPESLTIDKYRRVSVPLWPLLLVAAYLAIREVRRVSLQRKRRGHCKNCGYDLRGLPEPRCPECGSPFERDC